MQIYLFFILTSLVGMQQNFNLWALKYEVAFKESTHSMVNYIVVKEDRILSINLEPSNTNSVACYTYSKVDSTVDIRIINHRNRIYFSHKMSFEEYQDSIKNYYIDFINDDSSTANFLDSVSKVAFKATFSDSIPNVFLQMIPYEQIKYSPIKVEYDDRIARLTKTIYDKDSINEILVYSNIQGYKVMFMDELKIQLLDRTGYTYDQAKDILLESKQ